MKNLTSYLAIAGAIAFSAWLAVTYNTLTMVGDMFDSSAQEVFERRWNTLLLLGGTSVVGAAMLAYGLINLSLRPSETHRAAMPANGLAALLLLCTAILMLLGDFGLYSAFATLATAENLRADQFIAEVRSVGWLIVACAVCMPLAVGAVVWGSRRSLGTSETAARNPVSGTGFFGIMGGAVLILCSVWCLSGVLGLQVIQSEEHVKPAQLAARISTILVSTFGGAVGIAAFGVAFLLRALTPDGKVK